MAASHPSHAGADRIGSGEEGRTPPAPQGGNAVCPVRPSGGRTRDHDDYRRALASFAAEHFPDVGSGLVGYCADWARRDGHDPTPSVLAPCVAAGGVHCGLGSWIEPTTDAHQPGERAAA